MSYTQKISDALNKEEENVALLAHFTEQKLNEKLALLASQQELAKKNSLTKAQELLQLWTRQVQDAIELKREYNFEGNPALDINFTLPELADYEMIEKRQELLRQKLTPNSQKVTS